MPAIPLLGRSHVVGHIERALVDAVGGRGRFLLITGEPGIGKTTVAREAVRLARQAGLEVAWGSCLGGGVASPFAPWLEVLGPDSAAALFSATGAVPAGSDPREAEWQRLLAFHAVVERLRDMSAGRGLLVVLDDLQWADISSQLLLCYVAAHVPAVGMAVIGTCRETELDDSAPLAALVTGVDRLALAGLQTAEVAELVAGLTGEAIALPVAVELRRVTGGNPFFVTQVARLGLDRAGRPSGLTVPPEVEAVLSRRLAHLDEGTVRVLRAAAIVGEQVDVDLVAEVLGRSRGEVLGAFELAERARMLRRADDEGQGWEFVHGLFPQVCAAGLGLAAQAELHGRAADVLDRRRADPEVLAFHLRRAGVPPQDPRLAGAELAAATVAMERLAWEEAAFHFERAAGATASEHAAMRARALLGLGEAHLRGGDPERAGAAFEAAAEVGRQQHQPGLVARAALGFGAGFGGFEVHMLNQRQIDLLEEAAAVLPADSPLRPWVLARLSVALSFVGSEQRRLALADEAVHSARGRGDPALLAAALASRCDALAGPDHVVERLDAATEMVDLARRAGERPLELLGRRLRLVALSELGRMGEVDDEIVAFDRVATRHGDPLYGWYVPLWHGMRALTRGQLAEAERWAGDAAELGARAGSPNALVLSEVLAWLVVLEQRSATLPERFRQMAATHPELLGADEAPMFAWVLALLGRHTEARRYAAEIRAAGVERIPMDSEWLAAMTQLAEGAVVLGDRTLAAEVRERLEPYGQLCVVEGIGAANRGSVHRFLALLAALLDDREGALVALGRAAPVDEAVGALPAAHTHRAAAWALSLLGNPTDRRRAADAARRAADEFRALGLHALAEETTALAGEAPVKAPPVAAEGELRREGDAWALTWEGTTVRVRHSKGIADLAHLLARPGAEVHVRNLDPVGTVAPAQTPPEPLLDRRAVSEYRRRLAELEDDVAEADGASDLERAARLRVERDFLVAELGAAFGLGGRARPGAGDVDQRLRKAVGARIRDALDRLDEVHPGAARHLRHSVRTGVWCTYHPERPTAWHIDAGQARAGTASSRLAPSRVTTEEETT